MLKLIQLVIGKTSWEWIGKNRHTFVLVVLLLGNVYQYYDGSERAIRYEKNIKELNDKLSEMAKISLDYERDRSNTLEALLHDLVIKYNSLDSVYKSSQRK